MSEGLEELYARDIVRQVAVILADAGYSIQPTEARAIEEFVKDRLSQLIEDLY